MKKNRFMAWLLILSLILSVNSPGLSIISYAEETEASVDGGDAEAVKELPKEIPDVHSITDHVYEETPQESAIKLYESVNSVREQLDKNLAYILDTVPNPEFGTLGGEWSVLSLARGNYPVPDDYYDRYYDNVVGIVKEKGNKLDRSKWTEHSRLILAFTSIGKDVKDVGGYNQLDKLADYQMVIRQGINGPIFALLALDSKNYELPFLYDPPVQDGKIAQTTREALIQYILDREINTNTAAAGGWALGEKAANPDPDITAMAIQGLAAYIDTNPAVKAAVDRGIQWLSDNQTPDGGFASWGTVNVESIAQVVVALTAVGIDPHTDPRFVKNGHSAIDALLTFAAPDGGFMHVKPGDTGNGGAEAGKIDGMATDQGTYALVAYDRFVNGKNRLYDMTDTESDSPVEIKPDGDRPRIVIPDDHRDYIIPISSTDRDKIITIEIPSDYKAKVSTNLPFATPLPEIKAAKGSLFALIPAGAKVVQGDASSLELLTEVTVTEAMTEQVAAAVPQGKKLDGIARAFSMGGPASVEFSDYVVLTFQGLKGKEAAYIQEEAAKLIPKYAGDAEGLRSGKPDYAYDNGNYLVVKTKHFTDFVAYSSSRAETPGGGENGNGGNGGGGNGGSDGGGATPQPKKYATISVDKRTINKGYVVPATKVELQSGDTAWSLLKRMLDERGISYEYEWNSKYESVYVQSIAGDGEFDHGSGSGWMYNVNGWYPNYGASKYILNDGDTLQWRYTTDLGGDLGEDLSKWEPLPGMPASGGAGAAIDPNDRTPVIEVPKHIQRDYIVKITKELAKAESITINIPEDVKAKVIVNVEDVKDDIPMIKANKGDISVVFAKGTRLTAGDGHIELFAWIDPGQSALQKLVKTAVTGNETFDKIVRAFMMGNAKQTAEFDKPLIFAVNNGKGLLPGLIEQNEFTPIAIYESEEQGAQATKDGDHAPYAFAKGNDLYVKAYRMATFVLYTTGEKAANQGDSAQQDLRERYADADAISAWAYEAARKATQQGWIQGNDGTFKPKSNVTRAEFATILANTLGLRPQTYQAADFGDVAQDDWYYPYVNAAVEAGWMTGYNDRFHPNEPITREQMAATLARALDLKPAQPSAVPKDLDSVSAWARTDVETVAALQLMTGHDDRFYPQDAVTREMATVVAVRAYESQTGNRPKEKAEVKIQAVQKKERPEIRKRIDETAKFLQETIADPGISTIGGDWTVFGLARSGVKVPDGYYDKYYANVEKTLKEKSGKLHRVKYTEYDRVILALTSIGKSVDDVAGYNLREPLADFDTLVKQGINGPIFALIALDSKRYDIPVVKEVKTQTTREKLIELILNREIAGGGWALGEKPEAPDPDITAMAIQGLTPYYQSDSRVKAAVNRGVAWLSKAQKADGGYASWDSDNSESVAQVIVALTGLGIDPHTDKRFVKNKKSAVDALLSFAAPGGGFYHIKAGGTDNGGAGPGEVDLMATDQAMYALVAYDRFTKGLHRLYDMTDVK
ncbi:hypothetical protein PAE9249_04992 [Paenibacillus sp. CECT 9249]|uniref:S-layer homology domain-containing protein n=1 Tax=Paenibacillus sp. CECT 9249 TaxID=2845385 RepID=UPI001E4E87B4|nr:S-layer homology domain-containing protein [Paenibacillus sp. CECT 9249]CAH0122442.1 hypothetical protein PAE9249_04992 [Paenibacillus sp. CECT 9249]